jgi:hypothetical protein
LYLSGSYRPEISTAVGQLASFCTDPNECALRAVIRLYGFLLETKDLRLVYENKILKRNINQDIISIFSSIFSLRHDQDQVCILNHSFK